MKRWPPSVASTRAETPAADRVWFTAKRAADHYDFSSYRAFWMWQSRLNAARAAKGLDPALVAVRFGRRLRFLKADLDRAIGATRAR